ncbi:MAG: non-ribosomal peptide synthetase, partial [Actinobacteria bacterium]|nr:non-ribosomal peptide synthetase [Actinomycetota bacterium]
HTLVADRASWPVLLEDLEAAYLTPGRRLPARTTPFARWAARLDEWAHSAEVAATVGHWASVADGLPAFPGSHLPPGRMGEAEAVRTVLGPEVTEALLRGVPARHRANMTETVCAALLLAVRAWTGLDDLLVDVEGHGREDLFDDVDVTRTVGWFTSMYPVRLHTAEVDPAAVLDAAKRTLRAVPHKGLSHGALRYLHRDPEVRARLAALPPAPVGVNYLGRFEARDEALFALTDELRGPPSSPKAPRAHLLEMNAVVFEGSLRTTWTYAPAVHAPDDVACLAQAFDEALAALAAARPADIDATDFPLARLGDRGLDALRRYAADDG